MLLTKTLMVDRFKVLPLYVTAYVAVPNLLVASLLIVASNFAFLLPEPLHVVVLSLLTMHLYPLGKLFIVTPLGALNTTS